MITDKSHNVRIRTFLSTQNLVLLMVQNRDLGGKQLRNQEGPKD